MKKIYVLKAIKNVHQKTNTKRIKIILDLILCKLKYKASSIDYDYFEMYKMSNFERKTCITKGKNNDLIKKYNNLKFMKYVNNPLEFHKHFDKFLNRDWLELNSLKNFKKLCNNHKEIVAYSNKKKEHIILENINLEKLYKGLLEKKYIFVEESVKTVGSLKKIAKEANISIKMVTLLGKCLLAFLYIEEENTLIAPIEIETGNINYPAVDDEKIVYEKHPKSNKDILGITIPNWERLKEICELACLEIPEIGYIEWTLIIGEKRNYLLKGSAHPNHYMYQRAAHREHNIGIVPLIKKIEERKIES